MAPQTDVAVGINFGTTTSSVAVWKDGRTDVIANDIGDRTTPSAVSFGDEGEVAVGFPAMQARVRNAKSTVLDVKQLLGLRLDDKLLAVERERSSVRIAERDGAPAYEIPAADGEGEASLRSAEEVAALVFKDLKVTAESFVGSAVEEVVLTAPVGFSPAQRAALVRAAEGAGMQVLRVISEPAAACLAIGFGQGAVGSAGTADLALVFHVGGRRCEATVVSCVDGVYRVVASAQRAGLGGAEFDEKLATHFAKEFKAKHKVDLGESKKAMIKLRVACEQVKRALSMSNAGTCHVESLHEGMDFNSSINRGRFDLLCGPLFRQCMAVVDEALAAAGVADAKEQVKRVVMVGGASAIPKLRALIKGKFAETAVSDEGNVSPDELVALGAAEEAALLADVDREELRGQDEQAAVSMLAVPATLGVAGADGSMVRMIGAKAPLPARRDVTVTLGDAQTSLMLAVYEGEDAVAANNKALGHVALQGLTAGKDVRVRFHVDEKGALLVTGEQRASGVVESTDFSTLS